MVYLAVVAIQKDSLNSADRLSTATATCVLGTIQCSLPRLMESPSVPSAGDPHSNFASVGNQYLAESPAIQASPVI